MACFKRRSFNWRCRVTYDVHFGDAPGRSTRRTISSYKWRAALPRAGDHRMDIEAWLEGLGFERYVSAFRDNEIDWDVLPKLTSEDLREIGVAAIGHRRKLLDAIAALGASAPVAAVMAPAPMHQPPPMPSAGS